MNTPALLAGLGTSAVLGGVTCIVIGLAGRGPVEPVRPPSRWPAIRRALIARRRLAVISFFAAVAVLGLTGWPVAACATAVAVLALPKVVSGRTAAQQIRKLEALELWTRRLADLLVAGRALEQALEQSASRNVPSAITAPVSSLARRLRVAQMPTEQALRFFADELNDPVGDRIAAALILVARRRGKGASALLHQLAQLVAKDVSDRREVEAARAEHRTTVRWIIGILVTFTAVAITQRSYVAPFGTPVGQVVLAMVASLYGVALWWLHRLGSSAVGHRFLTDPGKQR
ncbi:type II secretion system F family protein [Microbispora amethystogenes]|uniref:Type II secretion system protein n=1 Tax=Microbispora amethystogenes TaxID=1427754 RepID=A0ABQ4FLI8_9ACTN|nr:type II secretion system F family protein [Microbispora amethystogenes]GIH35657.1 type II secretion system protein [Microbispora amethystogenes]